MKKFTIHCMACKESFQLQHPAISTTERLMTITMDCPNCKVTIKAPDDEILAIPMTEYMRRSMIAHGFNPEGLASGVIEGAPSNVISIDRKSQR